MVALLYLFLIQSAVAEPFRILVFPHQGVFSSPQGRETNSKTVTVLSSEPCSQYLAEMNLKHQWVKKGAPLIVSNQFYFSNSFFNRLNRYFHGNGDAYYVSCPKPFKIVREKNLESFSYDGDFVVFFDQNSAQSPIQIINLVDSESYVRGVVPSEVGSGWPMEALKSQAVAARTYAWWNVLNARSDITKKYDLDDTIGYQAYLGITRQTPDTDFAVNQTSQLVLKYEGKVIKAYFSADSGGKTETEKNVFGEDLPYCQSKTELYDVSKTTTEWERVIPYSQIGAAFSALVKRIEIEAADRNESGRVDFVTLHTNGEKIVKVPGVLFRRSFKLRSTFFDVAPISINSQMNLKITGRGYGHGVGMAQIGAKEYATQLGWTFDQIVKFYYTGVTLEPINYENSQKD
jgi:SpoIID/LytB domain protein